MKTDSGRVDKGNIGSETAKKVLARKWLRFQPIFPAGPLNTGAQLLSLTQQFNTHLFAPQETINKDNFSQRKKDTKKELLNYKKSDDKSQFQMAPTPLPAEKTPISLTNNMVLTPQKNVPRFTPVCFEYYLNQKELKRNKPTDEITNLQNESTKKLPKEADENVSSLLAAEKRRFLRNQPKFAELRKVASLFDMPPLQEPSSTLIVS